jgi:hypothetical protein
MALLALGTQSIRSKLQYGIFHARSQLSISFLSHTVKRPRCRPCPILSASFTWSLILLDQASFSVFKQLLVSGREVAGSVSVEQGKIEVSANDHGSAKSSFLAPVQSIQTLQSHQTFRVVQSSSETKRLALPLPSPLAGQG